MEKDIRENLSKAIALISSWQLPESNLLDYTRMRTYRLTVIYEAIYIDILFS